MRSFQDMRFRLQIIQESKAEDNQEILTKSQFTQLINETMNIVCYHYILHEQPFNNLTFYNKDQSDLNNTQVCKNWSKIHLSLSHFTFSHEDLNKILLLAAKRKNVYLMNYAIDKGADIFIRDSNGNTALMFYLPNSKKDMN